MQFSWVIDCVFALLEDNEKNKNVIAVIAIIQINYIYKYTKCKKYQNYI